MENKNIYIRADGNSEIGLGHVIRSCALADMLRSHFSCFFFIRNPSKFLKQEIEKAGCELVELPENISYEEEALYWSNHLTGHEIIVLDGYNFETSYQKHIKQKGCCIVCIDDIHAYDFIADIVLNHAGSAQIGQYTTEYYTQIFLGFQYSLLRKEFLSARIIPSIPDTLLICLGGADPNNDTLKVLKQAQAYSFSSIHVLVGSAYQYLSQLKDAIKGQTKTKIHIHQNLDAASVASLMQQCSSAILSPSSIVFEYMCFGGTVYLCQIADNQKHITTFLLKVGLAKDMSSIGLLAESERKDMAERQTKIFDGTQPKRLLQLFENICLMQSASISKATDIDLDITFAWSNDSMSRQMSYNITPIKEEEHCSWFATRLSDPKTYYYIFKINNIPFAQIRFEKKQEVYLLSYFIDPHFRGKGLGSFILSKGIRQLKSDIGESKGFIQGFVKMENISSCKSFEKMRFEKSVATEYINTYKYTLKF